MDVPAGIRAKLDRAQEHADFIEGQLRVFGKRDSDRPWATVVKLDEAIGKCEIVWRQDEPPPLRWAVMLGEFLYDLRSSMDHLARLLVIANERKPTGRTEFPVFKDEEDFEGRSCPKTQGMAVEVKTAILDSQPFRVLQHRPTAHELWLIHNLCNKDKHRLLHLTDPWVIGGAVKWNEAPSGLIRTTKAPKRMRLDNDALMASYEWDPLAMRRSNANVNMDFTFVVDVAIDEAEWLTKDGKSALEIVPFYGLMTKCLDYMNTIFLPTFLPFLT